MCVGGGMVSGKKHVMECGLVGMGVNILWREGGWGYFLLCNIITVVGNASLCYTVLHILLPDCQSTSNSHVLVSCILHCAYPVDATAPLMIVSRW